MDRRFSALRRALLVAPSALLAPSVRAATLGTRPITVVCPFSPGGTADAQLRVLSAAAAKALGRTVLVENRPGAAGTMGPSTLVGAPPDGHLLSMATAIALLRQPFIQPTRYAVAKDFTYIIGVTRFETGLGVRADS